MASARFTSALLRSSAEGLAGLAAARWAERGQGQDFESWRAHFRALIGELAAAIEDDVPQQFAARTTWAREAFAARGAAAEVANAVIATLEAVLEENLPSDTHGTFKPCFEAARQSLARGPIAPRSELEAAGAHAALAQSYLDKLLAGEEPEALELVLDAVRSGRLDVSAALQRVLTPAQREVGRLWHLGFIDIAAEHQATAAARRLATLLVQQAPRAPRRSCTVVVAGVEGDSHDLGVQLVAAEFELDGWRTIALGANVPVADVVAAAERHAAQVVALGATLAWQRQATAKTLGALRSACSTTRLLVGGSAFAGVEQLALQLGADAHASSPAEAVRLACELLGLPARGT